MLFPMFWSRSRNSTADVAPRCILSRRVEVLYLPNSRSTQHRSASPTTPFYTIFCQLDTPVPSAAFSLDSAFRPIILRHYDSKEKVRTGTWHTRLRSSNAESRRIANAYVRHPISHSQRKSRTRKRTTRKRTARTQGTRNKSRTAELQRNEVNINP